MRYVGPLLFSLLLLITPVLSSCASLSEGLQQTRAEESQLRYDPEGEDRDCADFDTHREAQAFFEAAGGPEEDRHRLDQDNDGVACEALQ